MNIGEYYAEYDTESGLWCVFHTDNQPGHAFSCFDDELSAKARAKRNNEAERDPE